MSYALFDDLYKKATSSSLLVDTSKVCNTISLLASLNIEDAKLHYEEICALIVTFSSKILHTEENVFDIKSTSNGLLVSFDKLPDELKVILALYIEKHS